MAKYDPGDITTYYFIIKKEDTKDINIIKAFTDNKSLARFYMDFHKCPTFKLRKVTAPIEDIYKIIEEGNNHDEISIVNLLTRDSKYKDRVKTVQLPLTESEMYLVSDESNTYMSGRIDYAFLNEVLPFLKEKYQRALRSIFVYSIIRNVIHNIHDDIVADIEIDQAMALFKSLPDDFG